jgi:hypothetical protein
MWIAGHVHRHGVNFIRRRDGSKFVQVTTASQIDWPQQGRFIEITKESGGQIGIGLTVFDHDGPLTWNDNELTTTTLAGISRALAANNWQFREGLFVEEDEPEGDRVKNLIIRVQDPFNK